MKILYLSDDYGKHNEGTKRSIFHEVRRRGYDIQWSSVHSASRNKIDGQQLLANIRKNKYDWVWIAHSWALLAGCTLEDINKTGAQVLGFGFSDPYGWNPSRLNQYNAYATNCFSLYDELKSGSMPITTIITAGDSHFHKNLGLERSIDVLVYGAGKHVRFEPQDYRIVVVERLKKLLPNVRIEVYGSDWGTVRSHGRIEGKAFLRTVNSAKLSVDLQQPHAPLAHRMFECMMCGTPVITRRRPETSRLFGGWDGIGYYDCVDDLALEIRKRLQLGNLASEVRKYSLEHHNVSHRVDELLVWIGGLSASKRQKNTPQ